MSGQEAPPKEDSLPISTQKSREDAIAPAQAIPDFGRMYVRSVQGVDVYEVLRLGSGNKYPKSYRVDLGEMTCTCEDHEFNRETHELCKHMAIALFEAPKRLSVDVLALQQIADYDRRIEQAVQTIERSATGLSADAQAASQASSESGGDTSVDAEEARESLQAAYDAVKDGAMATMVADGKIWINKTPDAPDWMFSAWLQEPEDVFYEPDDAPEDYFKNSILPKNVEAYIEEVLE